MEMKNMLKYAKKEIQFNSKNRRSDNVLCTGVQIGSKTYKNQRRIFQREEIYVHQKC